MATPRRIEFERGRDFTVAKPLTCKGREFAIGDPFDKTLVTTRRLRQLYDARLLIVDGDPNVRLFEPAPVVVKADDVDLDDISHEETEEETLEEDGELEEDVEEDVAEEMPTVAKPNAKPGRRRRRR